jgi:hypothetical protein
MHEAPQFLPGDLVRDKQAHDEIGRVETVRRDGMVNVRWKSSRTEWIRADEIEWVPGFKPKPQPTT